MRVATLGAAAVLIGTLVAWRQRLVLWLVRDRELLNRLSRAQPASSDCAAPRAMRSEQSLARHVDLMLLGYLLSNRLVANGSCPEGLAQIWSDHIVPRAVSRGCDWQLGMTAAITGLHSTAGAAFNGLVGRISGSVDGRWELMVDGPDGLGTVNVKPANLKAATDLDAIIRTWRRIPNHSQLQPTAQQQSSALPLHAAVAARDAVQLRACVHSADAALDALDERGRTALHLALEQHTERSEEVDELEEAMGEAESAKEGGKGGEGGEGGALGQGRGDAEAAAVAGRALSAVRAKVAMERSLVSVLLERSGAHVNAADSQERTPLHHALRSAPHDVLVELLRAGADPTLPYKGSTALHLATTRGDPRAILLLGRAKGPQVAGNGGASAQGTADARTLDVDGRSLDGWTPLGLAARANNLAAAVALLELGADPHATGFKAKSALQIAQSNRRQPMVDLLTAGCETTRHE